jgi:hypothetical protein
MACGCGSKGQVDDFTADGGLARGGNEALGIHGGAHFGRRMIALVLQQEDAGGILRNHAREDGPNLLEAVGKAQPKNIAEDDP